MRKKMKRIRKSIRWAAPTAAAAALLAALFFGGGDDRSARAQERRASDLPGPPSRIEPDMVDDRAVTAVKKGLKYLADTQRQNGSWLSGGRYGTYPSAMTSLAGMAMLASGSTPEEGPYHKNVRRAMVYIIRVAKPHDDGMIAGPGSEARSMYGHGFSMLFLAQCYGMQKSPERAREIKLILEKAAELTSKSQSNPGKPFGGWYYTPESGSDEGSVTVTQLQALRACRNAGLKVNKKTIERAVAYLKHCQMPDGGICYSASNRHGSRPAISAAGIACFYAAGVYDRAAGGEEGPEAKMVGRLFDYVEKHIQVDSNSGGHYFYTHYYLAQARYQRGGDDWKTYYPKIRDKLLSVQNTLDGSWQGDGVGTVYGTALALTILQLPYGHLPIYQR